MKMAGHIVAKVMTAIRNGSGSSVKMADSASELVEALMVGQIINKCSDKCVKSLLPQD